MSFSESGFYGRRTRDDDLWVQAGNDVVLFDLLKRQDNLEGLLSMLEPNYAGREVLERFAFALKLGIAGHEVESSLPTHAIRQERGRCLDAATELALSQSKAVTVEMVA